MDRSFLSQPEVIVAARRFVCIRLISYEDETEKEFISQLVTGEPANTAFALLTPEGERALRGRGPGRGPRDLFRNAADMARGMDQLAARYPANNVEGVPSLPVTLNAKVGLAVAASDLQPLVVVLAESSTRRQEFENRLAKLAWTAEFAGRLTYATAVTPTEIPRLEQRTITEGILCIEPDLFGAGGRVVREILFDQVNDQLPDALRAVLLAHVRTEKNRRTLAQLGLEAGIYYETGIPVSGRGEAADRARYKTQLKLRQRAN